MKKTISPYDNDTSKVYPNPSLMDLQESQAYHLKKITGIETYLLDEIEFRKRLAKKRKRFNTIIAMIDTGLKTSTVITGRVSIAAFVSGLSCLLVLH